MKVIIRCDSDEQIGLGHAMRCLAISQAMVEADHVCILVYKTMPKSVLAQYEIAGVKICLIEEDADLFNDAAILAGVAMEDATDWIVLDGYQFTSEYQKSLKDAGFKIMVIDDMVRKEYFADVILNQNPGFEAKDYSHIGNCRFLLGPKFVLLRKEIYPYRDRVQATEGKKKILLTMGGADPGNFTAVILQSFDKLKKDTELLVIVGEANKHKHILKEMDRENIIILTSPDNYFELLSGIDLAIHASGSTSWELAYLGIPGLCYVLADNQLAVAKALDKQGCSINMGWAKDFHSSVLHDKISQMLNDKNLLHKMGAAGRNLIDGNGSKRVIKALQEIDIG